MRKCVRVHDCVCVNQSRTRDGKITAHSVSPVFGPLFSLVQHVYSEFTSPVPAPPEYVRPVIRAEPWLQVQPSPTQPAQQSNPMPPSVDVHQLAEHSGAWQQVPPFHRHPPMDHGVSPLSLRSRLTWNPFEQPTVPVMPQQSLSLPQFSVHLSV